MDAGKVAAAAAAAGVGAASALVIEQYMHYYRSRRGDLGDAQPYLHSPSAHHCVVLVKVKRGGISPHPDLFDVLRRLRYAVEQGEGLFVYSGKARFPGGGSRQIPGNWHGCAVLQFRSAEHLSEVRRSAAYTTALDFCAAHYHCEFKRNRAASLQMPLMLLSERVRQRLAGESVLPYKVASATQMAAGVGQSVDAPKDDRPPKGLPVELLHPSFHDEPVVVINIDRNGSSSDKKANAQYGSKIMSLFAAMRSGPVHVGATTNWDGKADGVVWNGVVFVHYPSMRLFSDMTRSTAWNGMVSGKKLGDHFAMVTTPMPVPPTPPAHWGLARL